MDNKDIGEAADAVEEKDKADDAVKEEEKAVYSYHTFLFPFIWKTKADITIEQFLSVLAVKEKDKSTDTVKEKEEEDPGGSGSANKKSERWLPYDWEERQAIDKFPSEGWMQDYQTYQYFTDSANELLFNCKEGDTVRCFYYGKCLSKSRTGSKTGKYIIKKGKDSFSLTINNIRLNVYDAGIAILILELENKEYCSLDKVDLINEYGRRVNYPFLKPFKSYKPEDSHSLCADSIEIQFDGVSAGNGKVNPFKEDFLETSMKIRSSQLDYRMKSNTLEKEDKIFLKEEPNFIKKHTPIGKDDISLTYIMEPLQTLLDGAGQDNDRTFITTNSKHMDDNSQGNKKRFYIKPCVDDRMFVCCIVRDNNLSNELKGIGKSEPSYLIDNDKRLRVYECKNVETSEDCVTFVDGDGEIHKVKIKKNDDGNGNSNEVENKKNDFEKNVITDENDKNKCSIVLDSGDNPHPSYMDGWADETTLPCQLYKFMYIENDLTCQSPEMRENLLRKSIYDRWIQSGTLYGVTHHSICCITNTFVDAPVVNPFLTEYVHMAVLVLAQRSVILMLEDAASEVSNKFMEGAEVSEDDIHEIGRLQARYVKIKNQMLLSEVTAQEQGVELYEMLREQLYIEKNMNDLDSSMNNLRDVSEITDDRLERDSDDRKDLKVNFLSIALALMFICEPLSGMIAYWRKAEPSVTWSIVCTCFLLALIPAYRLYKYIRRRFARKRMAKK